MCIRDRAMNHCMPKLKRSSNWGRGGVCIKYLPSVTGLGTKRMVQARLRIMFHTQWEFAAHGTCHFYRISEFDLLLMTWSQEPHARPHIALSRLIVVPVSIHALSRGHVCHQAANQRVARGHMGPLWPTVLKPERWPRRARHRVVYGRPPD